MKKIALFGSTGSIGTQTLEVVEAYPERYGIVLLTGHKNAGVLKAQIAKHLPEYVFVTDQEAYDEINQYCQNLETTVFSNWDNLAYALKDTGTDFAVLAIGGAAGIYPAMVVIQEGIDFGLANKETLVAAGDFIKSLVRERQVKMFPIDSEHSAIFQCMQGQERPDKLILTASGGPFRTFSLEDLAKVDAESALRHPTWSMGKKITIDSATLMNKGLEVIEAHHLFDMPYERIEVVVHPESVIHSIVVFKDGSHIAQLGPSDMRLPIAYALSYPERLIIEREKPFSLIEYGKLHFEAPDLNRFRSLALAYQAGKIGKSMPTVLNGANEVAVMAFLKNEIGFLALPDIVEEVMLHHEVKSLVDYETIVAVDTWARMEAKQVIKKYEGKV